MEIMNKVDNIRNDPAILEIYRKCEFCERTFDVTALEVDPEVFSCRDCLVQDQKKDTEPQEKAGTKKPKRSFRTLPASGYSSLLPYQIPQVKNVLESIFETPPAKIVDACAHIGGDTIHFATLWPDAEIVSIDIDENAIRCLRENVKTLPRITVVHSDCTEWIPREQHQADLYYFDPPWGGPNYSSTNLLYLSLGNIEIHEIVNYVLQENLTNNVILKVPRNFDYDKFISRTASAGARCVLYHIRKPLKRGIIAYTLIAITK